MRAEQLSAYLTQLRQEQRYRSRLIVDSPQGVELSINGKSFINFCSNDYLGLANHPDLIAAMQKAATQYGVGSGAAHLINGHSRAHHALEEELADFVQRPRALLFSTGYMANLGVISALTERGDHIFEDRLNHASLIDAGLMSQARLQRYHHLDMQDLQRKLQQATAENKFICSDGVFSMDGDVAPVTDLAKIAQAHHAWLMIDDAHGLGVVGAQGRGTLSEFSMTLQDVPILMGTLGKALGTFGAFVAGSEELIETLIQRARSYIFTTALPPAIAQATRVSLQLVQAHEWRREQLHKNIQLFRELAAQQQIPLYQSNSAIQPIILGDVAATVQASLQLKEEGLLVSAIRPPTVPEGSARLRITLSALHSSTQIHQLIERLATVCHGVKHAAT